MSALNQNEHATRTLQLQFGDDLKICGREGQELPFHRENALVEHLAETFHVIFGDVDFTVSDRHAAMVLATALQQNRRHDRIRECLLEGADPLVSLAQPPPLQNG